ncbi:MAG TPA: hypothetical protein VHO48_01505, partial [Anaerolineaceae bacterium]|nr:hypothetical protein [Anaerolineaceae bacterium]
MVRKPTVVILILFALALLAGWVLEFSPLKSNRETPTPTLTPKLVTGLESGEIVKIDVRQSNGTAVSLAKNAENQFQFIEATDSQPDQGKIQEMVALL